MQAVTKIVFYTDEQEKFFGEGPCRLLHGVERTGSLRAAAGEMGMAYTKALKLLQNAEKALGFALTERAAGGRCGGGSRLTPEGFVELVFSMLITALLRGEEDCEPLLAVVRRVLY